jgi:outer membrane protein TolC
MPPASHFKRIVVATAAALLLPSLARAFPLARPASPGVEILTLERAIRRALQHNPQLNESRFSFQSAKNAWDDAWESFWLPTVGLNFSTTGDYTIYQLPNTTNRAIGPLGGMNHGYNTSAVGLTVGNYTLFNGFQGWNGYETAKLTFERAKLQLAADERHTRFDVTVKYFAYKTELDKLDAAKRSVEVAEAILDLQKSKKALKQATDDDVNSSNVDLLGAQSTVSSEQNQIKTTLNALNLALNDPLDTPYQMQTELKFEVLKLDFESALKVFMERSNVMADARLQLRGAQLGLETAEKARIPIPTVTLNGITLTYSNGYYGGTQNPYPDTGKGGNFDLSTSINLSLPLLGPGGFLGSRSVANARIGRDRQEITYARTITDNSGNIATQISGIKTLEAQILLQRETFAKNAALLDGLVARMTKGTVSRLEFRDAINSARDAEFTVKDSTQQHLQQENALAELLGLDHLPGSIY